MNETNCSGLLRGNCTHPCQPMLPSYQRHDCDIYYVKFNFGLAILIMSLTIFVLSVRLSVLIGVNGERGRQRNTGLDRVQIY